jgi:hypothetical protein
MMAARIWIGFWLPAVVLAAVSLVVAVVFLAGSGGVYVTVVNRGPEPLHTVTIQVTGRAHVLGDLAPEQSKRRKVLPTERTSVAVEFTGVDGKRVRLDADGEFQPGDRGEIVVELRYDKIAAVRQDIRPSE